MILVYASGTSGNYDAHVFQVIASRQISGAPDRIRTMFDHEPLMIVLKRLLVVEPRCQILLLFLAAMYLAAVAMMVLVADIAATRVLLFQWMNTVQPKHII